MNAPHYPHQSLHSLQDAAYLAMQENRLTDAFNLLERGMMDHPNDLSLRQLFGRLSLRLNEPDLAIKQFERILKKMPLSEAARAGLCNAFMALGKVREARRVIAQMLSINAKSELAWLSRAQLLEMEGDYIGADGCFEKLVELDPGNPTHRYHRGLNRLRLGRFGSGWQDYEARFAALHTPLPTLSSARWDGNPVNHLLLIGEQGLGDMIQAARWINLAHERAERITLACDITLASLFERSFNIETVSLDPAHWPEHQAHCPLFSLPLAFNLSAQSHEASDAYLVAGYMRHEVWEHKLESISKPALKVGLAWHSSIAHVTEETPFTRRSCPIEALKPLADVKDVQWVNLQLGAASQHGHKVFQDMLDLTADIENMDDTAALIAELDVVVSVDTSILHLAAALGKPTLALLPYSPSWRWTAHTSRKIWYESLQCYRQYQAGDWQQPVEKIANALLQYAHCWQEKHQNALIE